MDARCGDSTKALSSKKKKREREKKKKEKLLEKAIRITKSMPNNTPVWKEMNKLKIIVLTPLSAGKETNFLKAAAWGEWLFLLCKEGKVTFWGTICLGDQ